MLQVACSVFSHCTYIFTYFCSDLFWKLTKHVFVLFMFDFVVLFYVFFLLRKNIYLSNAQQIILGQHTNIYLIAPNRASALPRFAHDALVVELLLLALVLLVETTNVGLPTRGQKKIPIASHK